MNIYSIVILLLVLCHAQFEVSTAEANESGRRNMFINLPAGDDDCQRWDSWTLSGSATLNHMAESSAQHTFGIKVDNTSNGASNCDMLLGVFTAAGSFGCVIEGGASLDQITWCDSYPDIPVYVFNHNARRWGTFVALDENCTDGLYVNRFYMKNSAVGEKYWTWNQWVGEVEDGVRYYSQFQVESTADTGYDLSEDWAYVPPVYEWYAESFDSCTNDCNYEGGVITRNVVCRATKPMVSGEAPDGNHNYINWDGSKCSGLTKPDTYKTCPAGSCQWVHYASNWNCMGSGTTANNDQLLNVPTGEECQAFCINYSYAALWTHSSKLKCRCYHVCHEGGATSGGVYVNEVWEQVATGRRKN